MKLLAIFTLILGTTGCAYGVTCHACTDVDYSGGDNTDACWSPPGAGASAGVTDVICPDLANQIEYCVTTFEIRDGVAISVTRGCVDSATTVNYCVTTLDVTSNDTAVTTCRFHGTTDHSNDRTASGLLPCSTNCSVDNSGGACNYITGACVCNTGFSGSDCSTTTSTLTTASVQCVQCTTETDSTCATSTTSSDCPANEKYCSTALTYIYDASENVVKTVTTRGCSATMVAVDECQFTDIYTNSPISDNPPDYHEITCYSTCATSGCNTDTAVNGVIDGSEVIQKYCVQCNDSTGYGSCNNVTSRTLCPSGTTHCKSTVTYYISNRTDVSHAHNEPAYKLKSNVRECATAAVTASCTETTVGSVTGVKKVVCTETCEEDGCNTGWPNRPKCVRCLTASNAGNGYNGDGYDECLENPPEATDCLYPYEAYCVIQDVGVEQGKLSAVTGYPRRMTRGCASYDIGTACNSTTIRTTTIESCNRTCTTDGCNVGSDGNVPVQTMLCVMLPAALALLLQMFF